MFYSFMVAMTTLIACFLAILITMVFAISRDIKSTREEITDFLYKIYMGERTKVKLDHDVDLEELIDLYNEKFISKLLNEEKEKENE